MTIATPTQDARADGLPSCWLRYIECENRSATLHDPNCSYLTPPVPQYKLVVGTVLEPKALFSWEEPHPQDYSLTEPTFEAYYDTAAEALAAWEERREEIEAWVRGANDALPNP